MLARRKLLQAAGAAATALLLPRRAFALDYPTRPIHWIDDTAPGGSGDIVARLVGEQLSQQLGQPVIIDNRPGGSGEIGMEATVRAPADGYTLFVVNTAHPTHAALFPNSNVDFKRDFAPVAGIASGPLVMLVHPSVSATTLPEFIAYAKANPGKLNMASVGTGSPPHLAGELFKLMAGVDLTHVPYRGGALALTDLLAGHVQVMFTNLPARDYIKTGALRGLGVTTPARSDGFPELPAISEFVRGYAADVWFGAGVRSSTPADIIEKLSREIDVAIVTPTVKAGLAALDAAPMRLSPTAFAAKLADETAKWNKVIETAHVRVE